MRRLPFFRALGLSVGKKGQMVAYTMLGTFSFCQSARY